VAQTVARRVLESIFEASLLPSSYGFWPKRSVRRAIELIRRQVNDRRVLGLIRLWIRARAMEDG
jgi:retron-type reverse transcriptase